MGKAQFFRNNRIARLEDLENLRDLVSLEHIILTGENEGVILWTNSFVGM